VQIAAARSADAFAPPDALPSLPPATPATTADDLTIGRPSADHIPDRHFDTSASAVLPRGCVSSDAARNHTGSRRVDPEEYGLFLRIPAPRTTASPLRFPNRDGMGRPQTLTDSGERPSIEPQSRPPRWSDVRGDRMQRLTRIAQHVVPGVVMIGLLALGAPSAAQEVETPERVGSGSIVAPSPLVEVIVPVQKRIDVKMFGFYIGALDAPSAQVDVSIRATKFLTITPSYLFYSIPPSGLDDLANRPNAFKDTYDEHQFRIDGTTTFFVHDFEISARNMYVRRFRPGAADDSNRYRGRVQVAHSLTVSGRSVKPFVSYEAYYDYRNGGWNKDRVWSGVTVPIVNHVFFQPSYLWERTDGTKTINYVLFGLIVSAK
jgi:hypothetical protein